MPCAIDKCPEVYLALKLTASNRRNSFTSRGSEAKASASTSYVLASAGIKGALSHEPLGSAPARRIVPTIYEASHQ
jgi:hypothetical protein